MNSEMKILLCILIAQKTVSSAPATHSSTKYDLTESLRSSITGIFQAVEAATNLSFFKTKQTPDVPFNLKIENETFFYHSWVREKNPFATLHVDFVQNKMDITVQQYNVPNVGKIISKHDSKEVYTIYSKIELKNIRIKTDELFKKNLSEKYPIEVSFSDTTNTETLSQSFQISPDNAVKTSGHKQLAKKCKSAFLALIRDTLLEHGKTFVHTLRLKTSELLFLTHPNYVNGKHQYYYLISNFSYFCFNLRYITIQGLTNYQVLNKTDEPFTYSLWMKNIRGSMILDYGSKVEPSMQLNFMADHVSVSVDLKNSRINVAIRNYNVVRTATNASLSEHHSAIIIQHIESAIAASLMPSMKVWKTDNNQSSKIYDIGSLTGKILDKIVQKSDWKTLKRTLCEWVPFDDDHISNQTQSYDFYVSFPNLTINLISGTPYPEEIQCEFSNNLKITHEMKTMPVRKLRLSNKKGGEIDMHFHANFTSISFSQIKPNTTSGINRSCEFELRNNNDIKIEVSPEKNIRLDEYELELKKKIDTTLISMATERITQYIKPMVCAPFEICFQTIKMVDEFFLNFINKVLEKCSLRKSTN